MGVFDFIIDIKTEEEIICFFNKEYGRNSLYQRAFYFNSFADNEDTKFNAGISSVLDNFLPANHLIYNFLSSAESKQIYIRTNGDERVFDFNCKSDFISYMYARWEKRLDAQYKQFGTILLDVKKHRQIRDKLYTKYYHYL